MLVYRQSCILGKQPLQFRQRCLRNGGKGLKLSQQVLLPLGTDAGNAVQFGVAQPFAAQLPMVGNGEAVGFLLDVANEGVLRSCRW